MATIDLKLKSYDELQFEIMTLNTKNYLQQQELERYKNIIDELKKENEKLHKQVSEYQDEIFARDNNWYDMCD